MTEQLFPGPAFSTAPIIPRGFAAYVEESATPLVRHLTGYEDFAGLCSALGTDPARLASDLVAFAAFTREKQSDIRAAGLQDSAAIFFGNVLVRQRDDADWKQFGDGFPSAGNDHQQFEVRSALELLIGSDDEGFEEIVRVLRDWVSHRTDGSTS